MKSRFLKNKYVGRTKIEMPSGKAEKKTSNSAFLGYLPIYKFMYKYTS